jgi:aspartate/methionine/tyrosine aminotransferase
VRMFEGKAHLVPTESRHAFQPTLPQLQSRWGAATRGVILGSPANPTGTCIAANELAAIHAWIRERGGVLIVDEIYQGLVYERPAHTALELGDDVFVINSFSKYFGMTGWRLGWLVAPRECVRTLERFAQNAFICPPALAQHAALAAFTAQSLAICEGHRREYQSRRDVLLGHLSRLGFDVPALPDGAFYVYADCTALGGDSSELVRNILERTGVAITPGRDFGSADADRYVRFAYSQSRERLEEAMDRLDAYLRSVR